jgi:hypothetical protein
MRINLAKGKQYKLSNTDQVSITEKAERKFSRLSRGSGTIGKKEILTIIAIKAACSLLFASSSADGWP